MNSVFSFLTLLAICGFALTSDCMGDSDSTADPGVIDASVDHEGDHDAEEHGTEERGAGGESTESEESDEDDELSLRIGGRTPQQILAMLGATGRDDVEESQLAIYRRIFGFSDANGDGQLSTKEFVDDGRYLTRPARQGIFRASDSNDDGIVSEEEYIENRIITDEAKAIFEGMDANDDGKLTREEFIDSGRIEDEDLAKAVFDALDSDDDGELVIPEYLRVWGRWARIRPQDSDGCR